MESIREFIAASQHPHAYARALKESGTPIIGYLCSYTPEEIIHAAGLHPMRLFGSAEDISLADTHLQSYCCSLVRGALADVMAGNLEYLDGAVFPHTCDTIQRLSDIWRLNTKFRFFADVVLPVKLTTQSARTYLSDVLKKFRMDLEEAFDITISDEALHDSIQTFNTIRDMLNTLYEIRSENPSKISGRDLHGIVKGSMIMDRDAAAQALVKIVDELRAEAAPPAPKRKRVLVAGSVCSHPDVYTMLEKAGAEVVWDDLCTGSRYFGGMISTSGDPIEAIAQRYFDRLICPAKHKSITIRGESLVQAAREHDARGVIFLQLKFCDPHSFDYP
ncbi:MAG: 2-hydroxyacyl-CoA dehydratase family protein, partial [Desulfomonilia bacterium]|nr:2-hydroxyacyl-CoA dehydratase family protein [Desulfomonilia bacterium]